MFWRVYPIYTATIKRKERQAMYSCLYIAGL